MEISRSREGQSWYSTRFHVTDESTTQDAAVLKHLLWKLYHVEAGISSNVQEIEEKNESLTALRENHSTYDDAQKAAKKEVVRAQKDVTKQEKVVKTQEKALDDAKPELVAIDAKMAHAAKNLKKAELVTKTVEGELATRQAAADRFQQDLAGVQKAVARHTGELSYTVRSLIDANSRVR